jgi:hypothetical protein
MILYSFAGTELQELSYLSLKVGQDRPAPPLLPLLQDRHQQGKATQLVSVIYFVLI